MKLLMYRLLYLLMPLAILSSCSNDDDDKDDNGDNGGGGTAGTEYALIIENGALSVGLGASLEYTAVLVSNTGEFVTPDKVEWSSSDQSVITVSAGGSATILTQGIAVITATATKDGKTYTAQAPLGIGAPTVFSVVPSAILYEAGLDPIQLEAIYFGTGSTSFSYKSADESIASVSSDGLVTLKAKGATSITVTATGLDGSPSVVVPVLVVGAIDVPLPVTRVVVSPTSAELFRGENQQFTATAYNSKGEQVSDAEIRWVLSNDTVASLDNNGQLSAKSIGKTTVQAFAKGIMGQAEALIFPDTFIRVEPFNVTIAAGKTQQFTAKSYRVNRSDRTVQDIQLNDLKWQIPTYGLSIFDVATVDQNGLVTVKENATPGMFTFVAAVSPSPTIDPGIGNISVGIGGGGIGDDDCECGDNDERVDRISAEPTSLTFEFGDFEKTIEAKALDSNGEEVSDAKLVYCSNSVTVADVDENGVVTPLTPGDAEITICVGDVKTVVSVTVKGF